MARCSRCNKFMILSSQSGYCKNCESIVEQEKARRKAEEERKRQEEEARRKAEEERKRREEEARRKAEEERKRQEEEARRKAEEERIQRELEIKRLLEEGKQKYQNGQFNEDTISVLNNVLKLANIQSEEWQLAQDLLSDVKAKIADRENEKKYAEAMEKYEKADTLPSLKVVKDIFAKLASSEYKDSQEKLRECDAKIQELEAIAEEKRRLEEEERKRKEEERKRQEEEARRKAEEELRRRQEKIIAAFSSFPLRGDIHFGDSLQNVRSKDRRTAIIQESDSTHLVFPDAVSSISGGKTYYSFAPDGSGLKGMSYTYYSVFQRNPYDMGGSSAVKKITDTLLAGLKKKYGEPNFNGGMLLRYIKQIKGAEYQSLISDSDRYSGSSLWKNYGLFSRNDANRSGINVKELSEMNVHSKNVRVSIGEYYEFFGDQGWVIPVDGNYVVIHLVEDRRFRKPYIYVDDEMNIDIPWPFWFPAKPDYFVPAGKRADIEIHFMDLAYVCYTESEFNQIITGQKEAEVSAAKKAAEKEQKFLDEL